MEDVYQRVVERLLEAPIRDLEPIGRGLDKPGSFDKRDRKLLSNPKAIQKIRKQWEKTEFTFDMYLVNLAELNKPEYREYGEIKPGTPIWTTVQKAIERSGGNMVGSPDAITILFNGNFGADKVPLTGWTMAHRLGHAIRRQPEWKYYIQEVSEFLRDSLQSIYDIESKLDKEGMIKSSWSGNDNYRELQKMYALIFNQLGTMKSAREKQISRYYEFFYELLAQYLITGQVKFNKFPEKLIVQNLPFGRKKEKGHKDVDVLEMYNRDLEYYESNIESRIANVLHSIVGKVFLM